MMPIWESVDHERREACFNDVLQRRAAEEDWSVDENRSISDWGNEVRDAIQDLMEAHTEGDVTIEYAGWADIAAAALARMEILRREADGDLIYVFEIPDEQYNPQRD